MYTVITTKTITTKTTKQLRFSSFSNSQSLA
nr:MAG TPA: hypothetical protein [Caudoviricetes sp.]DAP34991.1 MAG TPA: hypothetical protein [Caudoviricetes sp.]DAY02688.1 MAG TPA: hypothetical protein [Caudoviricetes sp.]